jgi:hypothetical protein
MKGAIVFLGVFVLVLAATLGEPSIPPGRDVYYAIGAVDVDYPILGISVSTLVPAVFNGIIYGVVVWLAYSILSSATKKEKKELVFKCEACGATFTKMEELDEHKKEHMTEEKQE